MEPKSPGIEPKRQNPVASIDKGGTGKGGHPAPPEAASLFSRSRQRTRSWAGTGVRPGAPSPPESPQGVPEVSPVTMEPKELSLALLHPPVIVVATLDELLDTLPRQEEETLLKSPGHLHRDLEDFTKELRATLHCIDDTWRRHIVTSDDEHRVTSLSQALAAYKSTPQKSRDRVTWVASKWQKSVPVLVDSWAQLARAATKLRDTCREVASEAATEAATATARARELQAMAARDGTAEEHMMELGQALGREEGAEVVTGHEAWVRRDARVAASEARRATMERQWMEAALGLLERLVATCDKATAFPRELQWRLRDTETALEGTKKKFPDVPKELVAKVAEAERLWWPTPAWPRITCWG